MNEQNYGLVWEEKFETGCEKVDEQHRRMFELVGNLIKACTQGYDKDILNDTLDFLVVYAIRHFKDEEKLQQQYSYPGYQAHKLMHEDFKLTVTAMVSTFKAGGSSEDLSSSVNKLVVRWLVNHIQREDKKIGDHIRSLEATP